MSTLLWLFGWPHELLHALALYLIGRQPEAITRTHIDIPDDLSTGQYVFVAGLPALVFWTGLALCAQRLFNAPDAPQFVLWLVITSVVGLAAIGTLGDLYLIVVRLLVERLRPPEGFEE